MQIADCYLNDRIIINQQIIITVLEVKSSRIKLGVQTPKGMNAHRKEIYKRIQKECKCDKD